MMLDAMHCTFENLIGKPRGEFLFDRLSLSLVFQPIHDECNIRPPRESKIGLLQKMRPRIGVDCDMIDVGKRNASRLQTVRDGLRREAGPMLDAREPLFLDRCQDLAVANYTGRGIAVIGIQTEDDHVRFVTLSQVQPDRRLAISLMLYIVTLEADHWPDAYFCPCSWRVVCDRRFQSQ
jgi:hypothetical protein